MFGDRWPRYVGLCTSCGMILGWEALSLLGARLLGVLCVEAGGDQCYGNVNWQYKHTLCAAGPLVRAWDGADNWNYDTIGNRGTCLDIVLF